MTALPEAFRRIPLAHRGYHDRRKGRIENSPSAFAAAMDHGYGIELDVQLSGDGAAMVFHDARLDRLTVETGPIAARSAAALGQLTLRGGTDRIPTLPSVLAQVAGRVPLLIEIKDQDGALGPAIGALEAAVARDLAGYGGPVAVMSFNPHSVAAMARLAPEVPRGLTTCAFAPEEWVAPPERLAEHAAMTTYGASGCGFVSHDIDDLASPAVAAVRAGGGAILCWTVTSPEAEARARTIADNITFEGYAAAMP
jgi:glycerophosphoryl diester phosphodiesterase